MKTILALSILIGLSTSWGANVHLTVYEGKSKKPIISEALNINFNEIPNKHLTQKEIDQAGIFHKEFKINGYEISLAAYKQFKFLKHDTKSNALVQTNTKKGYGVLELSLIDENNKQLDRTDVVYFEDKDINFLHTNLKANGLRSRTFTVELRPIQD